MKDTGGPAFPHSRLGSDADGMTLRDYFAAQAMQGELASMHDISDKTLDRLTRHYYRIADAMLKARNQ